MSFLIKFLLISIAVLWLLRVAARFLFPWAMRKAAERMMQGQQGQQGTHRGFRSQEKSPKPDGKVRIDYVPPREDRQGPQKAGEFVDYEEVN